MVVRCFTEAGDRIDYYWVCERNIGGRIQLIGSAARTEHTTVVWHKSADTVERYVFVLFVICDPASSLFICAVNCAHCESS